MSYPNGDQTYDIWTSNQKVSTPVERIRIFCESPVSQTE